MALISLKRRIEISLGVEIPIVKLMKNPTVRLVKAKVPSSGWSALYYDLSGPCRRIRTDIESRFEGARFVIGA
jgi:hypothetical protein